MKTPILAAALAFSLAVPAGADPEQDASYVVDQIVSEEMFVGAVTAQRPVIEASLTRQFAQKGIVISDMDRFMDIFFEEFMSEFTARMQSEVQKVYLTEFTAEQLAAIAEFYATPAGQALVERSPKLTQTLAETGQIVGQRAADNAGARVATRLEKDGISLAMDRGTMDALLDFLR